MISASIHSVLQYFNYMIPTSIKYLVKNNLTFRCHVRIENGPSALISSNTDLLSSYRIYCFIDILKPTIPTNSISKFLHASNKHNPTMPLVQLRCWISSPLPVDSMSHKLVYLHTKATKPVLLRYSLSKLLSVTQIQYQH